MRIMVAAPTLRLSLYLIRFSRRLLMIESRMLPIEANSMKDITAYKSCMDLYVTTGPIRIWLSLGISIPTRVTARAASAKPARSHMVRHSYM